MDTRLPVPATEGVAAPPSHEASVPRSLMLSQSRHSILKPSIEVQSPLETRHPWAMSSLAMIFADWGKPEDAESVYAEMMARAA